MLGKRAPAFISSIVSAVNSNPSLKNCEPMSVISSAMIAATLDLPINSSLGMAHVVPYGNQAQFQLGWKGFVQLALRSGQYKTINATPILEGQLVHHNIFTGEMEFQDEAISEKRIGYLLYFKLLNGYEKFFYMTAQECERHAKKFSKMYQRGKGVWAEDFDPMALKTVVKLGLSKYGPLSVEMQQAMVSDQGVLTDIDATPTYPDGADAESPEEGAPSAPTSRLEGIVAKKKAEAEPIAEPSEPLNDFDPKGEYDA